MSERKKAALKTYNEALTRDREAYWEATAKKAYEEAAAQAEKEAEVR